MYTKISIEENSLSLAYLAEKPSEREMIRIGAFIIIHEKRMLVYCIGL